ncbi:hypothetical protein [uncultured Algibacter sp.]|uniref:hypothetical protein n=1 Tax=uncultured Algibacter sp. TaxID=298659 RepID=UPI002603CE5C|nr:hypothetical protein [uncultured Algibacter sp.]
MKIIKIITLSFLLFTLSCSNSSDDTEDKKNEVNQIVGYWVLSDFVIDTSITPEKQEEALGLQTALPNLACYVLSIDLRADNTVTLEVAVLDLVINTNPTNPIYTCVDVNEQIGTWSFEDNTLTLTSTGGLSDSATVRFVGDRAAYVSADPFGELSDIATELLFEKFIEI